MCLDTLLTRTDPVTAGPRASVLAAIVHPDVHLALWDRPRPTTLSWVDDLPWDEIDDIDKCIDVATAAASVSGALADAGYPDDAQGVTLGDEIVSLALAFAQIMDCDRLRWRLEVVETDACRKFHADVVTARLIMPLSGPTTQWIRRDAPDDIRAMQLGAVGLFKGRLWTDDPRILHRSPPIAGTGKSRLLLVINDGSTIGLAGPDPAHAHEAGKG